jgi:hypothetical protein
MVTMKGNYIHHTSGRSPKVGGNTLLHAVSIPKFPRCLSGLQKHYNRLTTSKGQQLLVCQQRTRLRGRHRCLHRRRRQRLPERREPRKYPQMTTILQHTLMTSRSMLVLPAARSSLPTLVALLALPVSAALARSTLSAALANSTRSDRLTSLPTSRVRTLLLLLLLRALSLASPRPLVSGRFKSDQRGMRRDLLVILVGYCGYNSLAAFPFFVCSKHTTWC